MEKNNTITKIEPIPPPSKEDKPKIIKKEKFIDSFYDKSILDQYFKKLN